MKINNWTLTHSSACEEWSLWKSVIPFPRDLCWVHWWWLINCTCFSNSSGRTYYHFILNPGQIILVRASTKVMLQPADVNERRRATWVVRPSRSPAFHIKFILANGCRVWQLTSDTWRRAESLKPTWFRLSRVGWMAWTNLGGGSHEAGAGEWRMKSHHGKALERDFALSRPVGVARARSNRESENYWFVHTSGSFLPFAHGIWLSEKTNKLFFWFANNFTQRISGSQSTLFSVSFFPSISVLLPFSSPINIWFLWQVIN